MTYPKPETKPMQVAVDAARKIAAGHFAGQDALLRQSAKLVADITENMIDLIETQHRELIRLSDKASRN